ncbi:MAG TPA: urease accessory protein UreD [Tepidisphaeraceae bacterium]|jgi:urease accessory protein
MSTTAQPFLRPMQTSTARSGDVVCEVVDGRSALTRVWSTDPLKLLTPRTRGTARQVVLSTYGGGLLGGDDVVVRARVGTGARLVLTTQSAGKIYRTDAAPSRQSIDATVGEATMLVVLPDVTCAYAGARFEQQQRYALSASADLVWLDWLSSGRHACGERWAMREIASRTEITVAGQVRLRETLSLCADAGALDSPLRVGQFDCYATLAMLGPSLGPMADAARAIVRGVDLAPPLSLLATDSSLAGGAIFRILGPDAQAVQALLRRLLAPLQELLGEDPWGRKW